MIIYPPPERIAKRPVKETRSPLPPLTLIATGYEEGVYVRLQFNQPIDIAMFVPDQVTVSDETAGEKFTGSTFSLLAPDTIEIQLLAFEQTQDPGILLWVSDDAGIISLQGQAWAGVSGMPI
jgi:hypothetical protein